MAIWFLTQASHKKIQLVELGPGRGTLMADILRTFHQLRPQLLSSVHLVEASPALKEIQAKTLHTKTASDGSILTRLESIPVHWHAELDTVPKDIATFFIAHEFFGIFFLSLTSLNRCYAHLPI